MVLLELVLYQNQNIFSYLQFLGDTFEATSSTSNLDLREEEFTEVNKENEDANEHDDDFMILDSASY